MILKYEKAFKSWDKKSADDIRDIYLQFKSDKSFISNTLAFLDQSDCQTAATWLLKCHFEHEGIQEESVAEIIYDKASKLKDWQSRLVILQSMQYLPIPAQSVKYVEAFARNCLIDSNKFVRAWAYNALYLLSRQYPIYRDEAEQFLKLGLADEPASIQARIRQCIQQGYPE
ncbi:MAG: hypothetical protein GY781_21855 [Gammaproteobacteria bacterium]|nr:hypothetical protein [Gammaproteobacteria bacterium]